MTGTISTLDRRTAEADRTPPQRTPRDRTALVIGATAGLAAGLAANLVRKVAVQAPTALAGDWADALAAEHKAILLIFDRLAATGPAQTTRRAMYLMQLKHALARHAMQEENAVYPALRDGGQADEADSLNHDHGYVKQYLYDLDVTPRGSPAWAVRLRDFRTMIEKHMEQEEADTFPRLRSALTPDANAALTRAMNREGLKIA